MENEVRIAINSDQDIVIARQQGRTLASKLGFNGSDLTVIATAISEVARNIVEFAGKGELALTPIQQSHKQGLMVVAHDDGPGIPNIQLALQDGFSTTASLGLGLPGSRRLMDEFTIVSAVGKGTTVTMRKWVRG
ncbi:MAG: anti-sigma regulatory factor [Nitrospirae bacterium]|nr:MAG: anti-sigma regulatory factor [Nitrospirota bacterium]